MKTEETNNNKSPHHAVIIGGGFGGLYAAKELGRSDVKVTLIDKRNFHLFQPLLYQVATGSLSPGDIASPLRGVLKNNKNVTVLLGEAIDLKPEENKLVLRDRELTYDSLIVATGVKDFYFGRDEWEEKAPPLKTVENALEMRRRILEAYEQAEKESDPEKRRALLTFVIVGGGPTGVELAGALAELAYKKFKRDFRNFDTGETRIFLVEGMERVLPPFAPELSAKAETGLRELGVTVRTKSLVTNIEDGKVTVRSGDETEEIEAETVLWAAGVKASGMGKAIASRTGASVDRAGRVVVEKDLSVPGHPNIFVIGDLANYPHQGEKPLPGVAPVAMQQGCYAANAIKKRLKNKTLPAFKYIDYGSLAVIGRNRAVVDLKFWRFSGFLAWIAWVFVHIYYVIEFDNKLIVMIQWAWSYFTRDGGALLITEKPSQR
ncbi:MAG: NAD(P)/FAD-dependent oxidoreductase [Cyanobacteriota bacterium]|nr:NAD(P)/FAD-dependent oxidoreductase [Cyanobacteriota bacterium]